MRRLGAVLGVTLVATAVSAGEFRIDPGLLPEEFVQLSEAVADVIVFPNAGPAEPGGVTGFDLLGVAGGPQVDSGEGWWVRGIDGDTTAGVLYGTRVIGRKGLPFGIDVGAQAGTILGESFFGAELKWAFLPGGMISPALALRASYSRLDGAPLDVEVGEVQAVISKGFTVLTPYAALGYRRVNGSATYGEGVAVTHEVQEDRVTGAAGVRLSLVPLRIIAEVRQGWKRGFFVGVGVGL